MTGLINVVPCIVAIVYTILDITKTAVGENEKFKRFIPLTACLLGVIIGIICFYFVPGVFKTNNLLIALVIGAASGLSATGANQAVKQLKKEDNKTE